MTASLPELRADCARCAGLCCVAPAFAASADFAIEKRAGQPCPNLQNDLRCRIHSRLRERGFPGCVAYDCFGAGQRIVQETFGGADWRGSPQLARRMFDAFAVLRALHELLVYLDEAFGLEAPDELRSRLSVALAETVSLAEADADALLALDLDAQRRAVNDLLLEASRLARAAAGPSAADHRGADLAGADLRGADLRGASLRGASLLGARLADADLELADLTGADVRGADLRGARLHGSLFVTQPQLTSARGDARTTIPPRLARPLHW